MSARAQLRPLRDVAELQALIAAAAADDHIAVWPTVVAEKAGELVGYASVGQVALVNLWMHTKKFTARDSRTLVGQLEKQVARCGFPAMCFPCPATSPFAPYMAKLGYEHMMDAGFWYKTLGGGHG